MRIGPIFGSVFRFSHLKSAVFRFWCLERFASFLQFSLWFSVFVNNDGGFSDFSVQYIVRFFLPKRLHPVVTVIPRDHLQLEECMIVSSTAVIWVVTAAKQTMKR